MNVSSAIRQYESDIERGIRELIGIRSVLEEPQPGMPYGRGVDRALRYMLELGERLGFAAKYVDGYAGHLEYGSGDELAAVLVHVDTVPEGAGWTVDPFGGELRDGTIFGRGASDNKGPAIVALYALRAIADMGIAPRRTFRVIVGTNEENGMTDMDHYLAAEKLPDYAFVPDAGYPIIHAEKAYYVLRISTASKRGEAPRAQTPPLTVVSVAGGKAANVVPERCEAELRAPADSGPWAEKLRDYAAADPRIAIERLDEQTIRVRAEGRSGHGSNPHSGINAIAHMAAFLRLLADERVLDEGGISAFTRFLHERIGFEAFGESLGIACSDGDYGRLTVNLAAIRADGERQEATLNVRVPPTLDDSAIIARLRGELQAHGMELEIVDYLEPLFVPGEHPLIRKLSRAYETVTGEPAKLLAIGGGTYARKLRNRGVAFGAGFPGLDTNVHRPDEFVRLEDMMRHGEICTQAIYELLYGDEI
ncbi:MAG: Sapep family Mn(2+)-dependent dipeptidase [Paenibacillaceae bacterium]|nr:Sapep family Mn(2+)-dependent dipeptidase [Paenibacillaceae bacterium]